MRRFDASKRDSRRFRDRHKGLAARGAIVSRLNVSGQLGSLFLAVGLLAAGLLSVAGCGTHPVPEQPSWADVQPILRGECSQCHGSTALQTGLNYRLDFFDMTSDVCGDAARAIPPAGMPTFGPVLAAAAADLIYQDIEPTAKGGPPKMPPQPGAALYDWEREMLENWTAEPMLVQGSAPTGNHVPSIQVTQLPSTGKSDVSFIAVLSDPDGDDVVGVIEVAPGQPVFAMNRTGSFAVDLDASAWPSGTTNLRAVLCDGWTNVSVPLGSLVVNR